MTNLNLAALEAAARAGLEVAERMDVSAEFYAVEQNFKGMCAGFQAEAARRGYLAGFSARTDYPAQCNAVLALTARVRELKELISYALDEPTQEEANTWLRQALAGGKGE